MGDYPLLAVPVIGGGIVIALMSLVHVLFAHYSVGTGIVLYGLECADPKGKDPGIQRALRLLAGSVVMVNLVLGALTGVGIWFCISLYAADATQYLIQKFVWLWATEWTFFVVEIVLGYIYFYRGPKIPLAARRRLAGIYAAFSWGTLVVITGILSYMLTSYPGGALSAWLNASCLPSIALRTLSSVTLAVLILLLLVSIKPLFSQDGQALPREGVFRAGYRFLVPFVLLLPIAGWYRLTLPAEAIKYAEGGSVPMSMFMAATGFFSALITVIVLYAWWQRRVLELEAVLLLVVLGGAATWSAEFVREGIRKPYVIRPIMYSHGMLKADLPEWQRQAEAKGSVLRVRELYPQDAAKKRQVGAWSLPAGQSYEQMSPVARGERLYATQCAACHTTDGFNALCHLVNGWQDRDYAAAVINNLNKRMSFMPPFVGTGQDVQDLTAWAQATLLPQTPPGPDLAKGDRQ